MSGVELANGATIGMGALPHRDLQAAAAFALHSTTVPTIPTLPRRSPAEGLVVQALIGIDGVTVGQYGAISVDVAGVDPVHPVHTDVQHDAFAAFRAFLALAPADLTSVKWQLVGPVTLGMALVRAGVPEAMAFEVAVRAVRSHLQHLLDTVAATLPAAQQVVFVDEPDLVHLTDPAFPLAPDTAIDLVSGALAAVEGRAVSGLHCCGEADWSSLISTGPNVLALPVHSSVAEVAGYLQQFLDRGGVVAWGAVAVEGPIPTTAERPWRRLSDLWCDLVQRGCDPVALRKQSLVSTECGLGMHSPAVAERVSVIVTELGRRVHDQATATRFVLGA